MKSSTNTTTPADPGIEVGRAKLKVALEYAAWDAEQTRKREELYDLIERYNSWGRYAQKDIVPRIVTAAKQDSLEIPL